MGKKLNTNPKALEARERKELQKRTKYETAERQKLDALWRDDDKHVNRKIDRQREKDLKQQEERDRKAALKAAYEKDMEAAEQSAKSKAARLVAGAPKISRATIQSRVAESNKQAEEAQVTKAMARVNVDTYSLVPNLNKLEIEGENATSVTQALEILSPQGAVLPTALSLKAKFRKQR